MENTNCPICDAGGLKREVIEETFTYKEKSIKVPDYVVYRCAECGEGIVDKDTLKKTWKVLGDFYREVDGLLTGPQIKRIRKKLEFTQEQMAEVLGGGLKAFARYESGRVCQSRAMDNLLRILDAKPDDVKVLLMKDKHSVEGNNADSLTQRKNITTNKGKRRQKTERCTA